VRRVLANVRNGSAILLHDRGGNRTPPPPTILRTLKSRGYTFYTTTST
jgi:peptidoglycan/xylan/chitin deacetylase (PgdA/CDA1 family)